MRRLMAAVPALLLSVALPLRAQCADGTPPPCSVGVLLFRTGASADKQLAESLSQNVATSLGMIRGVKVTPWALVLQEPYLVDGYLVRSGTRVRLSVEVIHAQGGTGEGTRVHAKLYEAALDSLHELGAAVALDVAAAVGAVRETPEARETAKARWNPTWWIAIYLLLLATTAWLVARKRTHWLNLIGVAILPPVFIGVLWDAYRSAGAKGQKETPERPPPDWAGKAIRPHLIQKTEILARDVSSVRAAIAERRNTTKAGGSWALLHFSFAGYNDDPRALWEIPEVREWSAAALKEFPFLPFILEGDSCRHFLPCVLPVEVLSREPGAQQVKIGGIEAANTMKAIVESGNSLCRMELSPSDPATAERLIEQATERLVAALRMSAGGTGAPVADTKPLPAETPVRTKAKELADEWWAITGKSQAPCAWCETPIHRNSGYVVKHRNSGIVFQVAPAFICEACFASDPRIELFPGSAAWLEQLREWNRG